MLKGTNAVIAELIVLYMHSSGSITFKKMLFEWRQSVPKEWKITNEICA